MKIKENVLYVSEDHSLFTIQFGHIRRFLSVDDVSVAGFNIDERVTIALEAIKEIPRGPFMPKKYSEALEVALREEKSTDILRQIWVSGFKGSGHEVGAGRRPTSVPSKCKVTYVDAFTFDEASDGSFINQANEGFVSVSIYESAETLNETVQISV